MEYLESRIRGGEDCAQQQCVFCFKVMKRGVSRSRFTGRNNYFPGVQEKPPSSSPAHNLQLLIDMPTCSSLHLILLSLYVLPSPHGHESPLALLASQSIYRVQVWVGNPGNAYVRFDPEISRAFQTGTILKYCRAPPYLISAKCGPSSSYVCRKYRGNE